MTAPLRESEAEAEAIEVWPPVFELGPELIADRAKEAHRMRTAAMRNAVLRCLAALLRMIAR